MNKPVDLLEVYTAGARINPEPSAALPQAFYGDPAKVVLFAAERCAECVFERVGKDGLFCGRLQNYG